MFKFVFSSLSHSHSVILIALRLRTSPHWGNLTNEHRELESEKITAISTYIKGPMYLWDVVQYNGFHVDITSKRMRWNVCCEWIGKKEAKVYTHKRAGIELVLDPHTFYLCVFIHFFFSTSISLYFSSLSLSLARQEQDEEEKEKKQIGDSVENLVRVLEVSFFYFLTWF